MDDKVTIYFFKTFDVAKWEDKISKRPATLQGIARARGKAIMEAAVEIEPSQLDGDGFRRK